MKTILIFSIFLTFQTGLSAFAQNTLSLKYKLLVNGRSLDYTMYYDGTASVFILKDSELKRLEKNIGDAPPNSSKINVNMSDSQDFVLYKNYQTQQMKSREVVFDGSKCIVLDTLPSFAWTLLPERKKIGELNCQKATTTWRCSQYEVWFTADIALSIGPWKLNGLPGLIVEANNTSVGHKYSLSSLSKLVTPEMLAEIQPPQGKDRVYPFNVYAEIQKKELKKMEVFLKAKAGNPESGQFKANIPECF